MGGEKRSSENLAKAVLASIIAALVVTGVNFLLVRIIPDQHLASFLAALIGTAALLLGVRLRFLNVFDIIGSRYLDAYTGIIRVYASLNEAASDLQTDMEKAKRIDLLLHIGRREFGVRDALFSEILKKRATNDSDLELRILHIDENSPYLSGQRAERLGRRQSKWVRDVRYVREQIVELLAERENLRVAPHKEPFVWRLFIFDDVLYVSGYLYSSRNDQHAPVFKIRSRVNSLYAPFRSYYDHLWRLYAGDLRANRSPNLSTPA